MQEQAFEYWRNASITATAKVSTTTSALIPVKVDNKSKRCCVYRISLSAECAGVLRKKMETFLRELDVIY
jgi:hypothetical protein